MQCSANQCNAVPCCIIVMYTFEWSSAVGLAPVLFFKAWHKKSCRPLHWNCSSTHVHTLALAVIYKVTQFVTLLALCFFNLCFRFLLKIWLNLFLSLSLDIEKLCLSFWYVNCGCPFLKTALWKWEKNHCELSTYVHTYTIYLSSIVDLSSVIYSLTVWPVFDLHCCVSSREKYWE